MTHKKMSESKIFTLLFSLIMGFAFIPNIAMASPMNTVYAADETQIDTLGVAFRKVEVGDTLDTAFEFENATAKTLKVPVGANYTATLVSVSKNGQGIKLWDNDDASLPWSRVETQFVEKNVAYCVRVRFKTNDGYKFVRDLPRLKSNMQVLGAELGKGKDIEIWDTAGINSIATIVNMDFLITKGMTYIGNMQTIYPEIGKSVTGTIGIAGVDTGFCISGAPAPYTYKAKIAPIGTEIQTSNVFDKSNCYYQITAVNSMDYGTMYIMATAADGKTCDIPVRIAAVSGGHEHTWSDFGKIDFEYHGYRKCTDSACPGIAYGFDTGSQYAAHEFVGECTEKCTKCGNLDNPNAKHNLAELVEETPATCVAKGMKAHYKCTGCGKYFDENKNETTEEALKTPVSPYYGHNFGFWVEEEYATCQSQGRKGYKHCSICDKDYDASNKEITDWVIPINPDGHELGALIAEIPATCNDTGVKEHRDCNLCGKHCNPITKKEIADLTIPATGVHDWNAWVSNGDGTHTRTCNNSSHSETRNCYGGTATCDGKAVCSACGEAYGEKLGHDWGEVKYTWMSDNTCKAERICKHDSTHTESETVTATETIITAATCKEKGKMKYTATFVNTAFTVQEKEVDIDFAPHTFGEWKDEIPATAEDFGTKGHKDCTVCGKHFDKDGNEITELIIAKIGTYNVVINGESEFYADGESVTVTAEDKEGKVFKGWQDESGKIISTDKSYTFTVTGERTLNAVYEDVLAVKNGLSGGQIAGIVIGSVAVAGIGAFSIFWFAVKKKSFADLGVALKNGFMAIGKFFKNLGAKIKSLFTKKK